MEIKNAASAAAAYRDATRIAEKIVEATESGEANAVQTGKPMKPDFAELVGGTLDTSRDVGYKGEITSSKAIAREADMHDMITAVSNAELTLNSVVAVRDKVISAYNDIIKMAI